MATRAHSATRTPVLSGIALTVVFLVTAAMLTPQQSPILPIEISVVFGALGVWFAVRGSRIALGVLTAFATLLVLLAVHILTGDLGSSGAREVVPDFLILISAVFVAGRGILGLARGRARA